MQIKIEASACDRRAILITGLSSLALSACGGSLPDPPTLDITGNFIDAHCHIFNAHDIPVTEFLVNTAMREVEIPEFWIALSPIVTRLVQFYRELDDPELDAITLGSRGRSLPTEAEQKATFKRLLARAVADTASSSTAILSSSYQPDTEDSVQKVAHRRAPEMFDLQTPNGHYTLNAEAAALKYLFSEFGLHDDLTKMEAASKGSRQRFSTRSLFSTSALNRLSTILANEAASNGPGAGAVLYVAKEVCQTRMQSIEQLDKSLGVSIASNIRSRLYLPALVDFDCWYGTSMPQPSLSMDKQTKIMARLSLTQNDPNRFVNGYVAFDPLRHVLVKAGILSELSPLQAVKDAIEYRGFLGVKLYPPMGFAAFNNASYGNEKFGPFVQPWIERLKERSTSPGPYLLGAQLDDALRELYIYCLANDVPIMAHCSNSQASIVGSGVNAAPQNWKDLLNSEGGKFRTLRLNLAHFGSIWCHEDLLPIDPNESGEYARCIVADSWTDFIVECIGERNGSDFRYPNLYFDIADLGDISTGKRHAAQKLTEFLDGKTDVERSAISQRILYGTDWFFLALYGREHVYYVRDLESFIQHIAPPFGSTAAVFSNNASRFLGLVGGKSGDRLRKFYATTPDRSQALETLLR